MNPMNSRLLALLAQGSERRSKHGRWTKRKHRPVDTAAQKRARARNRRVG